MNKAAGLLAVGGAGAIAAKLFLKKRNRPKIEGQVALITGGSRGLGLALAEEFAHRGTRIAICARNSDDLGVAEARLRKRGAEVLAIPCDVTNRDQVEKLIKRVISHFNRIDILVNNAGTIVVGPVEEQTEDDFRQAMEVMFWGTYLPTMVCMPYMRTQGAGRIANITSIGGRFSMPHLLPYNSAKFAATGFSEGLQAELAKDNITVTTITPGLMRTGSYRNALFKGHHEHEYGWFAFGSAFPLTAMSAGRAARQIVDATTRGRRDLTIGVQALLASKLHGMFPGLTAGALSIVNRLLPKPTNTPDEYKYGYESETAFTSSPLFAAGLRGAKKYNQLSDNT